MQRQIDGELEANLTYIIMMMSYIARPCLKKHNKQKTPKDESKTLRAFWKSDYLDLKWKVYKMNQHLDYHIVGKLGKMAGAVDKRSMLLEEAPAG